MMKLGHALNNWMRPWFKNSLEFNIKSNQMLFEYQERNPKGFSYQEHTKWIKFRIIHTFSAHKQHSFFWNVLPAATFSLLNVSCDNSSQNNRNCSACGHVCILAPSMVQNNHWHSCLKYHVQQMLDPHTAPCFKCIISDRRIVCPTGGILQINVLI